MNTTHPRLATILPAIAAEIDIQRPMLSPLFASSITVQIEQDVRTVWLHCANEETYNFLSIPTQLDGVRNCFGMHGFRDFTIDVGLLCANPAQSPTTPPLHHSTPAPKRTSNALTFYERKALENWMQQPDNTHFVAHESDADAARQACKDLDPIHFTAANIASMRKLLGIDKVKPEKPQPLQPPEGLTLADLQARIQAHEERLDAMHVEATGMKATIAELHRVLTAVVKYLDENLPEGTIRSPLPFLQPFSQSGQ